jgi:hypothetical protein
MRMTTLIAACDISMAEDSDDDVDDTCVGDICARNT